jgi:hypothetical protein
MESYWIELVCDSFAILRIILKVLIDKIWEETRNFSVDKAFSKLKENINYKKLLEKIVEYLDSMPKKVNFNEYFKYFNFTFSEKEIFRKVYHELKAKSWKLKEDFLSTYVNDFLKNWKKLDKRESRSFYEICRIFYNL